MREKILIGFCPAESMLADMITKQILNNYFWNVKRLYYICFGCFLNLCASEG